MDVRNELGIEDLPGENWKVIPGFYDYQISSEGRVKNIKTQKIVKPWDKDAARYGYLCVDLANPWSLSVTFKIAHLVAAAFIGPREPGMLVLHGPAGRYDNSISNLRYGTHKDNAADMLRDGTRLQGETSPVSKLTAARVRGIKASTGATHAEMAEIHSVHRTTVDDVLSGKTWKHVA